MSFIAVNHHYIRPSFDHPHPGIHGIDPARFASELETLGGMGTFVSASDVEKAVRGESSLPKRSILVTFDDGLREQYDHALPVLREKGVPAIFFVNTGPIEEGTVSAVHKIHLLRAHLAPDDFVAMLESGAEREGIDLANPVAAEEASAHYRYDEPDTARLKFLLNFQMTPEIRDRLIDILFEEFFDQGEAAVSRHLYMTPDQVGELGREGMVGSHAHHHLSLGHLSEEEAGKEIRRSSSILERWAGRAPVAFSYPYGSKRACPRCLAEDLEESGIRFAFTMERAVNRTLEDPLFLGRFDNNDVPGGKAGRWGPDEFFTRAPERSWYDARPEVA